MNSVWLLASKSSPDYSSLNVVISMFLLNFVSVFFFFFSPLETQTHRLSTKGVPERPSSATSLLTRK